jgi:hypothetical protein
MADDAADANAHGHAARVTNLVIREFAGEAPESVWEFLCECGCLRPVKTRLRDFDAAGGAWLPGHRAAPRDRSLSPPG